MTVQRGQYYQSTIFPTEFFFVNRVYSTTKILMYEIPDNFPIYQTEAQIAANYILIDYLPDNRLSSAISGQAQTALAYCLTGDFLSATVGIAASDTMAKAFAPTTLRARLTRSDMVVQASLISLLILGGNVASQGRVLQAQADQG